MIKEKLYNIIAQSGIWFLQRLFPEYFAKEPLHPTDRYIEYPFIIENLPKSPCKILDVGCSGSMFPLLLKAMKYEIFGIDIRPININGIYFNKEDICQTHFENNYFDVIIAISTIEHIGLKEKNMNADIKAIKEIYRILKPKGLFLITIPIKLNLQITRNHKIYNQARLCFLLKNFNHYEYKIEPSPEADYDLALIKAMK